MFNLEAEQRKLMFFECPVHEGDAMTKVCLDSRCDHSSLLCARCAETNHPQHYILSLKQMLDKLEEQKNGVQVESLHVAFEGDIEVQKRKCFDRIRQTRQQLIRMLDLLEEKAKIHFDKLTESIHQELSNQLRMNINSKTVSYDSSRKLSEVQDEMREAVNTYKFNQNSLQKLSKQIETKVIKAQHDRQVVLDHLIQNNSQLFNRVFNSLSEDQGFPNQTFDWSLTDKHPDIKLNKKVAVRHDMWSMTFVCALMNKIVNVAPPFHHRWILLIKNQIGMICIGMCLESTVRKYEYSYPNWQLMNHGNYMIDSSGHSYHSQDITLNDKLRSFDFKVGDQIQVDFDLINYILSFKKNNGEETFEMQIPPAPVGENYRPCVYLWKAGDAIEIIQPPKRVKNEDR